MSNLEANPKPTFHDTHELGNQTPLSPHRRVDSGRMDEQGLVYNLPAANRVPIGKITEGIDFTRGIIKPSYMLSNGTQLGAEFQIAANRAIRAVDLTVSKFVSGSICHNLSFELEAKRDGRNLIRTATLFFPSGVVNDPISHLLDWTSQPKQIGDAQSFDIHQLIDPSGRPLADNLFNLVESSAERLRKALTFGQKPKTLTILATASEGEALKLDFVADIHTRQGEKRITKTFYMLEDRLLTPEMFQALQNIYRELPEGLSLQNFRHFRDQQFYAWLWRKYLEPGGASHRSSGDLETARSEGLANLLSWANGLAGQDENQYIFASKLSSEIIRYLKQLGQPVLESMRMVGQRLFLDQIALDKGEFTSHNLFHGIPSAVEGKEPTRLDPQITALAAYLHHEAWMAARKWVNQLGIPELEQPSRSDHVSYDLTKLTPSWIRDCGNIYGLCFMLGTFGEERFTKLRTISASNLLPSLELIQENLARALSLNPI